MISYIINVSFETVKNETIICNIIRTKSILLNHINSIILKQICHINNINTILELIFKNKQYFIIKLKLKSYKPVN